MRRDPLRDVHPDRRNLLFKDAAASHRPDAGAFEDTLRHNAKITTDTNQHFFEQTYIIDWPKMRSLLAGKIAAQIDDRIPNQLTRPVIRNVSPAIDLMQLNAALRKEFIRGNDIRPPRVPSELNTGGYSSSSNVSAIRFSLRAVITCAESQAPP